MKKLFILASAISFSLTALASSASAMTSEEFFDQLNALIHDCNADKISVPQWKEQTIQLTEQALKEGIIPQQTFDILMQSFGNTERIILYNRDSEARLNSCKQNKISAQDFQNAKSAELKILLDANVITQEQYQETLLKLSDYAKECEEAQKANQLQIAAQAQQTQEQQAKTQQTLEQTQEQQAKTQAKQEELIQKLNDLSLKCQSRALTLDKFTTQYKAALQDALKNKTISQDDFNQITAQIPQQKTHCENMQSYGQNIDSCAKKYGPTQDYRQCAEAEFDKLVALGYVNQDNKIVFLQTVDARIAEMAPLLKPNSGHELNPRRDALLPDYQKRLNTITYTAYNGLYNGDAYFDRAIAVLDEADHNDLLTKFEYNNTREAISVYKEYLESLGKVWVNDYKLISQTCSGSTCTSTFDKIGEHMEDRIVRDRSGLEISVGLSGGLIWDDAWEQSPYSYDELHMDDFWEGHNLDGVDRLAMAGLSLSLGYTFHSIVTVMIEQDFNAGKWLGNAGKYMDFTQILAMTFFGAHFIIPFWTSRFQLGFTIALGFAYSNGDDRNQYLLPNYKPAYIFDDALNPGVAFAAKAGLLFDFFITPEFAFGFKLDYNYIFNSMSGSTFDANFGYQFYNAAHNIHFLQPGIQLTWTIPSSNPYRRSDTIVDPNYFNDISPYPAPFDVK